MKKMFLIVVLGTLVSGCTQTEQYTGHGAALGAATGAIIGNQHRDRAGKGAMIGAVVGGLAGSIVGQQKEMETRQATSGSRIVLCPSCNNEVDVSGLPDHSTVLCPYDKETQFTY